MKILALIPSRYGSSRFEGKPLADILGLPMVVRVFNQTMKVFDCVYVATDDKRIEDVAKKYNCNVVMTSSQHKSGTDRCREALDKIEKETQKKFDIVINIQGDEPFIHTEQLQLLAESFSDKNVDIATLVKPFDKDEDINNNNSPKVVLSKKMYALYFSRSVVPFLRGVEKNQWQDKHTFYKHIGLYAYRSDVLREITSLEQGELEKCESLEQLRWLENGYSIKCSVTNHKTYAIDTPEDLKKVIETMKNV
ncbi:MAG: 3-deoxy-manno-octulosonate cytidylyltransferase [Bacteroidetes bacterium]|nr:3-deoxy-manno-octulosonate cytidylyltransferase [Bacteroidota bacterium]